MPKHKPGKRTIWHLGKSLRDRAGGLKPQAALWRLGLSALIHFARRWASNHMMSLTTFVVMFAAYTIAVHAPFFGLVIATAWTVNLAGGYDDLANRHYSRQGASDGNP